MKKISRHCVRSLLCLCVTVLALSAIAISAMRVLLPKINHFEPEIVAWVNQATGVQVQFQQIGGYWDNLHPYISLTGVDVTLPEPKPIHFHASNIDVQLDVFKSLLNWRPIVSDLRIDKLALDIRSIDLNQFTASSQGSSTAKQDPFTQQFDQLLLRQINGFSVNHATINYQSLAGANRTLNVDTLRWRNQGHRHRFQGMVSLADVKLNSLHVNADFVDHGSLASVSGQFYVSANNVSVTPWLSKHLQSETGIRKGEVSFKSWLTLKHSKPISTLVKLEPSVLEWQHQKAHQLAIESGVLSLSPQQSGWQVSSHSLKMKTDNTAWPDFQVALNWQPKDWLLNISEINISSVTPLINLFAPSTSTLSVLNKLSPAGSLKDVRLSMAGDLPSLRYSAELKNGSIAQWYLLPTAKHLDATIRGSASKAFISAQLTNETLPYGPVFQAPLKIEDGQVNLVWQKQTDGWSLWSNNIDVVTPDLKVLGEFRLDVPETKSPLLSFYSEASLAHADQTWRYLPRLAMGKELSDYLASAIQGGQVSNAKILWYGRLADFPYSNHSGIFQASVPLQQGKFQFEPSWPAITNLQMDMLFQNDAMYMNSRHATLNGMTASLLRGKVAHLSAEGRLQIHARAQGSGPKVRAYMNATPLSDSVGAALNSLQVQGKVSADFHLDIPLNGQQPHVWGVAKLRNNKVQVQAPPMDLSSVSGDIAFNDDKVSSKKITATWLTQPVSLSFAGRNQKSVYKVGIDVEGDWQAKPLLPYVGRRWIDPLSGRAPWQAKVDLQLKQSGFNFQAEGSADLKQVTSDYPYPLNKAAGLDEQAKVQVSGNQRTISARLAMQKLKYQTEIDLTKSIPILQSNYLLVGKGNFKPSPVSGNVLDVRSDRLDLDSWLTLLFSKDKTASKAASPSNTIAIPTPERISLDVKDLQLATLDWHDVSLNAKRKSLAWYMKVRSLEAEGEAHYLDPYDLSVSLQRLQVYVPGLDKQLGGKNLFAAAGKQGKTLISEFDRSFHDYVPNITLLIKDFWFQGYRVGKAKLDLQREGDKLAWKDLSLDSGSSQFDSSGYWSLSKNDSHTHMKFVLKGDNNTDLMQRFGITSGIQKAPFNASATLNWKGAPWSMQIDSLDGSLDSKFGKGVISNVSGAARLLGLFSLDSIIRKMQLDFTGVFDKGMAFNSITGSGKVRDGVFVTNDLKMDAVAGEMTIKGLANLNTQLVDAEVNFVPDITSGIPVLTAFAVTPLTALYVFAVTTVLSPVVEVFTQVNYEVKGPLDHPIVTEISRTKGEYQLPEKLSSEL